MCSGLKGNQKGEVGQCGQEGTVDDRKEKDTSLRCDIAAETWWIKQSQLGKSIPGQGNSRHRGPEAGFVQGARCRHDVSKGELGGDEAGGTGQPARQCAQWAGQGRGWRMGFYFKGIGFAFIICIGLLKKNVKRNQFTGYQLQKHEKSIVPSG